MAIPRNLFTYLKNSGSIEAAVNGSVTPVEFSYSPTKVCQIHRMIVTIEDNGSFTAATYGSVATLTNGIDLEFSDGSVTTDLLDGAPIKSNVDWAELCYDAVESSFSGGGNKAVVARWTFTRSGIPLYMEPGDSLIARINDDLTALVRHRFQIQGFTR